MKKTGFVVFALFVISVLFVYHEYFFFGKIPFPANLLVSFYSPWDSQIFPGWEHGIPNKPLGHDALRFFFPIKKNIIEAVRSNIIPLWNPYIFTGSPFIANMQSSYFYPSTYLYFLVPLIDAWSIGVVATPLLSSWFMYLYLQSLKIRKDVSVIVSFLWAYSGFFAVWSQESPAVIQSSIWLPLILYLIERFKSDNKIYLLFFSIIGITLSFFGGHLQFTLYTFIFSTVYLFLRLTSVGNKKYLYIGLFMMVPLLLASIQLIPAIEAFLNSARSYGNSKYIFDIYLVPITHLVNIIAPDWKGNPASYNYFDEGSYYDQILYVGFIPILFAFLGFQFVRKNTLFKIYSYVTLITLLFGFHNIISIFLFRQNIPFFSSVIPSRIFYLTSFSLLMVAAFSINELFNRKLNITWNQLVVPLLIPFILLTGGWVYFFLHKSTGIMSLRPEYPSAMMRNLLLPSVILGICTPLFLLLGKVHFRVVIVYILCCLALIHQYYSYTKNVYFSERDFIYPSHPIFSYLQKSNNSFSRVVGFGRAAI